MTDDVTKTTAGGSPRLSEELGRLVACPLCGASEGYVLSEGSTYRWWDVHCVGCGEMVAECASDRRTMLGTYLPKRWPAADEAWNLAGAYCERLRASLAAIHCRVCHGAPTPSMGEAIASECEHAMPELKALRPNGRAMRAGTGCTALENRGDADGR